MASLFVKHLTTLDFSYLCLERGLVGETWIVDATLTGELNEQGMVFDFGHVKKSLKASLNTLADHKLLVPIATPATIFSSKNEQVTVKMTTIAMDEIHCQAPAQAILLVDVPAITIEAVTSVLEQTLMHEMPSNVSGLQLTLYPETIHTPFYHYSHSLKKHLGNCQRIAHGHRSQIIIEVDGKRSSKLEADWSQLWKDIYIGTREDLLKTHNDNNLSYHTFGHRSEQGYFELTIATERCYLIDTDTTVELLAEHIANNLFEKYTGQSIKVIAYEGVDKGAVSEKK